MLTHIKVVSDQIQMHLNIKTSALIYKYRIL